MVTEAVEDRELEGPPEVLEEHDVVQEDRELVEHVQEEVQEDQAEAPAEPRVPVAQVEEAVAHGHEDDTSVGPRRPEDRLPPEEQVQKKPQLRPRWKKPMTASRGNLLVACLMTQTKS